jgi:hypothetical protein
VLFNVEHWGVWYDPSAPCGIPLQVIIPHHETFSTTIQPSYNSTKG